MNFFKKIFRDKNNSGKPPVFPPEEERDRDVVTREIELIPYFVYSNSENIIIGEIYLSEEQSYQLNAFMKYKGRDHQDIVFLRE